MGARADVNYDELQSLLADAGVGEAAAAVHGAACGHISVYGFRGRASWRSQVLDTGDEIVAPGPDLESALVALYDATANTLGDALTFRLLLPSDDTPMPDKAQALADWAGGFLHGLGGASDIADVKARLASPPLDEIVADLVEISRAAEHDDDDETDIAYTEVAEYLKVVAQLVYEELTPVRSGAADGTVH